MLTDAKVRTAKPRPKAYKIADATRLFLMVTPSGGKLWRWNYEYDGKNKTMAFGAYPFVSLAEAREKRDHAYSVLCEGHDPRCKTAEDRGKSRSWTSDLRAGGARVA